MAFYIAVFGIDVFFIAGRLLRLAFQTLCFALGDTAVSDKSLTAVCRLAMTVVFLYGVAVLIFQAA